jgi:hypothetical protein
MEMKKIDVAKIEAARAVEIARQASSLASRRLIDKAGAFSPHLSRSHLVLKAAPVVRT